MHLVMVYMTAANRREARRIATALLNARLAACVNELGPLRARYWWRGRLEAAREIALLAKTRAARVPALIRCVKALHSYEVPCIVVLPLAGGHPPFLRWVAAETRPPRRRRRA